MKDTTRSTKTESTTVVVFMRFVNKIVTDLNEIPFQLNCM